MGILVRVLPEIEKLKNFAFPIDKTQKSPHIINELIFMKEKFKISFSEFVGIRRDCLCFDCRERSK